MSEVGKLSFDSEVEDDGSLGILLEGVKSYLDSFSLVDSVSRRPVDCLDPTDHYRSFRTPSRQRDWLD